MAEKKKRKLFFWLIITFAVVIVIFLIFRFLTLEDSWICKNGTWQKHGNPSAAMPSGRCK
jgi:hypothetical protein